MILLIMVVAFAMGVYLDIARKEWRNYSGQNGFYRSRFAPRERRGGENSHHGFHG